MNEAQLSLCPAFAAVPIYDESDERAHSIMSGDGKAQGIRECTRMKEVEECLENPKLVPLGGVRFVLDGKKAVVVYFGELV